MLERDALRGAASPAPPVWLRNASRGLKGTLRDSGAANPAVDHHSSRRDRANGASVSSLFAP
jgi:hypothetical protein